MAKKQEVRQTKTEIIDKAIEYTEYAIAPVTTLVIFWTPNGALWVSAIAGFILSGLRLAQVFINKGK